MQQTYVLYVAVVAAIASLLMTSWKIWADRDLERQRRSFERSERAVRENYERNEAQKREAFQQLLASATSTERERFLEQRQKFELAEREKRESFESSERTLRQRFMSGHDRASVEAEARIKSEIESFIQLEKWREESWHRNLSRLEQASKDLTGTAAGIFSLIDEGPYFTDARMIQETARVLDVFGDFQTSVSHFAIPKEMSELAKELVSHITMILLTLSPSQAVRQSDERKALLAPLRTELETIADKFLSKCGDFERDPAAFLKE
ncbi:MAG: hypothetical protein WKG03_11365 [Telluria sp.]